MFWDKSPESARTGEVMTGLDKTCPIFVRVPCHTAG
jgi:hypothetical protein